MTFCLESTIIKPENESDIKNAVILLHGYGGDGNDRANFLGEYDEYAV